MRTPLIAALGGVALLTLAACSASPLVTPSTTPTSTATSAAGDCVLGDWHLDTDDLAAQIVKLASIAADVSDVATEGDEQLTFGDDGAVSMNADLDVTATVNGQPVNRSLHTSGSGQWQWVDEGTSLTVTDWKWDAADTSSAQQLPMFDLSDSGDIGVVCSADELTLTPAAAPVTGTFQR